MRYNLPSESVDHVRDMIFKICETSPFSYIDVVAAVEYITGKMLMYRAVRGFFPDIEMIVETMKYEKLSENDKSDLDVIRRIRNGELKNVLQLLIPSITANGAGSAHGTCQKSMSRMCWLRMNSESAVPAGLSIGAGSKNEDGTLREPEVFLDRCAWCGKSLTTDEFITSLDANKLKDYGKSVVGGFRLWAGDFEPSEKLRKAMGWNG